MMTRLIASPTHIYTHTHTPYAMPVPGNTPCPVSFFTEAYLGYAGALAVTATCNAPIANGTLCDQLGGRPSWPGSRGPPPAWLSCQSCHYPMFMLLQCNTTGQGPGSSGRYLYVFACNSAACSAKSDGYVARLMCQRSTFAYHNILDITMASAGKSFEQHGQLPPIQTDYCSARTRSRPLHPLPYPRRLPRLFLALELNHTKIGPLPSRMPW
jgi:hypothetical protein